LAYESGVAQTVDPLGGSYYVEALTDEVEHQAQALLVEVDSLGGAARAVELGFFESAIARAAYEHQQKIELGERVVVGVNAFAVDEPPPVIPAPGYSQLAERQKAVVRQARGARDEDAHRLALSSLREAAGTENADLMEPILRAVRARATVQETCDVLRDAWGTFLRPGVG
jgi:methylmalonyl-CoA mutase N-terminal domain/subunit